MTVSDTAATGRMEKNLSVPNEHFIWRGLCCTVKSSTDRVCVAQ